MKEQMIVARIFLVHVPDIWEDMDLPDDQV